MKHFKSIITIFVIVFLLGIVMSSWGALTESGSISFNNGLYASGDNWANAASTLSWNVFQLSNGNYEYDYSLTLANNAKDISHVIIQTSPNFTRADMLTGTTYTQYDPQTWSGQGNSDSGIPAPMFGIKWDLANLTEVQKGAVNNFNWTIVTDRAPTMGNFYGRDGNNVYAFSGTSNNGTGSFNNLVVVPDTVTPIPAAAWLLGTGLVGLIRIRRKNGK
jgi:hypothetical protein